jgi:hypothetical protein
MSVPFPIGSNSATANQKSAQIEDKFPRFSHEKTNAWSKREECPKNPFRK